MPIVLTRPVSTGTGTQGMSITNINGQPTLTVEDTSRSNKILSVAEIPIVYSKNSLNNLEWINIGNASDADSSYIADFDGTLVGISGHCENVANFDKNIHLYINLIDHGVIGSFTGPGSDIFINNTLDIDFNQGDTIRLRAVDINSGQIQDSVIKLTIKWRG